MSWMAKTAGASEFLMALLISSMDFEDFDEASSSESLLELEDSESDLSRFARAS